MRLLFAICLFLTPPLARACDPIYESKVAFDEETYIFEGRVAGLVTDSSTYAEGLPPVPGTPEADAPQWAGGVLVQPTDIVNAPQDAETYAVFPAGLGSMCEPIYSTQRTLAAEFEIGERVYVVAQEGAYRALSADAVGLYAGCCGNLLTRASWLDDLGVSPAPWPTPLAPTGRSLPDLSRIRARAIQRLRASADDAERMRLSGALMALHDRALFEYERDLAGLHRSGDEERLGLLLKVRAYHFQERGDCEYASVVDRYLSEERRDRLGGYLIVLGNRAVPTAEMCREADRIMRGR